MDMPTNQQQVDEFLRTYAPEDVQDTIAWLVSNGYALVSQTQLPEDVPAP